MKAEDIIKEIDPDYQRCSFCKRLFHISKLNYFRNESTDFRVYNCRNSENCANYRHRKLRGYV